MLTPRRHRGEELIDDPRIDPLLLVRSLRDVARANTLFGGRRAALIPLRRLFRRSAGSSLTLVDVGTGLGDLPNHARGLAARRGVRLTTIGIDASAPLAHAARSDDLHTVRADALRLPLRDGSADVVLCSQLLHHFENDAAVALLHELRRVARGMVIVADLRRSWLAAALFWLASWPLRFERVTRHDGTLSVLRGFTARELQALVRRAGWSRIVVRRRLGFRLVATTDLRATSAPAAE